MRFYLNNLISQSNNTYAYTAYIETLLSFGDKTKKSQLSLWYQDTPNIFDSFTNTNKGFQKQKELAVGSKKVGMIDKFHLDLCFQDHYLFSKVVVKLRLDRSKDDFC